MAYSVAAITKKADCDVLINDAKKEKNDLEFRKLALQRQQTSYTENSVELEAELTQVNGELAAYDTIIAGLPDGELKTEQIKKKKKAELKQFLLTDKQHDYGVVALLAKELDLARLEKDIEATDNFIAAIEAHKATLP